MFRSRQVLIVALCVTLGLIAHTSVSNNTSISSLHSDVASLQAITSSSLRDVADLRTQIGEQSKGLREIKSELGASPRRAATSTPTPNPSTPTPALPHPTSVTVGTPAGESPTLCSWVSASSAPARFPGLNFCPAPVVEYMVKQHQSVTSATEKELQDMLFLDVMFMLNVIKKEYQLSMHVINLGANPSSLGEDDKRNVVSGDDTTALNYAGWKSVNYDVPQMAETATKFYEQFPLAQLDVTGQVTPKTIASDLKNRGVPTDVDFLKIDIDSFDCDYLEEILVGGYQPKVIDIELASSYPPPVRFSAKYVPNVNVAVTPFSGCSLQEAVDLLQPYGYTLIQYPLEDGWFVRDEYLDLFGPLETDAKDLFYRGNPHLYGVFQMFDGMKGAFHAVKSKADPDTLLSEIKKAHAVAFDLRPELRGKLNYKLDVHQN